MTWMQELKGWVGQKLNGISYNIDIINFCPLRCPSCAIGSIGRRPKSEPMSIDLFRRILDKAQREGKVRKVQLYAYSDPCFHPDLHLFVQECTDRGIESMLSTMLQTTQCDFEKVIEARPTEFRISFPGWDKMEYYQRNAKKEIFNEKFPKVCALPRHPETKWNLVWHLYNDNANELHKVKELAKWFNLHLVVLPAIFMSLEKTVEKNYTKQDKELITHLLETPEESISRMRLSEDWCDLWKQITIDAKGTVYLCQLVYEDRFQIGFFLDPSLSVKEIQKKIRNHSFCGKCMKAGGNVYQYCFADMAHSKDPISEADKLRRKSGMNELLHGALK